MTKVPLFLFTALSAGCAIDDVDESVATSELSYPDELPAVPGVPTPAGYGHYCSVVDPTNGGWALGALPSNTSDPCAAMARQVGSKAEVRRAGLWAVNGNNNVMVRCDGLIYYGRAYGESAVSWIYAQVPAGSKNCVFNISPTALPIFGKPFNASITGTAVFDYDYTDKPWDTTQFGQAGTGKACAVDRTGREKRTISGDCIDSSSTGYDAFEPAYDWSFALNKPLFATADGIVRRSYARHTAPMCSGSNQLELFIETQVGTGHYAEHFVMAYHHMNPSPDTTNPVVLANVNAWGGKPMVPDGTIVHQGDVVAYNGTSGCSGGPHLDFMVFRLTNLTGARAYPFQALETFYAADGKTPISGVSGVNGWQGQIDPFGWAAPRNVDPGAWIHIGEGPTSDQPPGIVDGGAFSINLWNSEALSFLPHN